MQFVAKLFKGIREQSDDSAGGRNVDLLLAASQLLKELLLSRFAEAWVLDWTIKVVLLLIV